MDPNGHRTDYQYDGFGRAIAMWQPDRNKLTQLPNVQYQYIMGSTGPTALATSTLNTAGTGFNTSYIVYDGQLRQRQTQAPAVGGGAILTGTRYDSRGLAIQADNAYFVAGVSWGSLYTPTSPVPSRTLTTYDNTGRNSVEAFQVDGVEKWRTSKTYGGDHIDTTVPAGGVATRVVTDAIGQTTQLLQYHGNVPGGTADTTTYEYDAKGNNAKLTDPAGSIWTFQHDLSGRLTKSSDPDRGDTTYTYDDADQQLTATDSRGITLSSVYDELGRVTDRYSGSTLLVHTGYDTLLKGQQDSTTRYVNGHAYTTSVSTYDALSRPTETNVVIPANEGALAGTYTSDTTYNADGSVHTSSLPAIGGTAAGSQPGETLTYGYNTLGLPTTLSGVTTYVSETDYDQLNRVGATLSTDGGGKSLAQLWNYESGTGRLLEHGVYDSDSFAVFQDEYYTYDDSGDVTSAKDETNQYGAGADDNQCFRYDYAQRLTNAWTPSDGNCGTTDPVNPVLGGPAPYWQSWTYDSVGDRLTQTDHNGSTSTTATSHLPTATAAHPHGVTSITTGTTTSSFTYDGAGNTHTRSVPGKPTQTLGWDDEGHLASVTDTGGSATYVYDAAGSRLIAHDSNGATLYLGGQQLHLSPAGAVSTTRYYGSSAVRTNAGLSWTVSDPHGTNNIVLKASDLTKTERRTTPFGQDRGTNPAWPTDRGFVGGTVDPTGLTQLGARSYDSAAGRFLSVDPQFSSGDPQSFNGYAYAHNNPTTGSDPSGLSDVGYYRLGTLFEHWRSNGYNHYRAYALYGLCQSNGACVGYVNGGLAWVPFWSDDVILFVGELLFAKDVKIQPETFGPRVPPNRPDAVFNGCPHPPPPPPPPPSCGFWDVKCGWNHPGRWWSGNKGWVEGAGTVLSIAACLTGVGCALTAAVMAGVSIADRTYSFVHNKEYNDGAAAWGSYAFGVGLDVAGAWVPGEGEAADRALAGSCLFRSFTPDTKVKMADGTVKPIGDVKVGDKVLATDPTTGKTVAEPVTALHRNKDTDILDLTVRSGDHKSVIHTTHHHPFWDTTTKVWTDAGDLRPGDQLDSSTGVVTVVAQTPIFGPRVMDNLTVEAFHTYYVMAGNAPVLVHNCPTDIPIDEGEALHGPFHRLQSPTQSAEVAQQMVDSGELWGRAPRVGLTDVPQAQAHLGPLPEGRAGVEFYTRVPPGPPYPGQARWLAGSPGVREEDGFAKVPIIITKNTQ